MSEEQVDQTTQPAIDVEAIKASIQADLEKKVEEKIGSRQESLSKEEVALMLDEHRRHLASTILGEDQSRKDQLPELSQALLRDPAAVLNLVKEHSLEEAQRYYDARLSAMKEEQAASMMVAASRPDIMKDEKARDLFNRLYDKTDDDLSPQKRVELATRDYDLLMESAGGGSAEDRIAKAQSFASSAAAKEVKQDKPVDAADLYLKELQERQDRRRKITNQ